MNSYDIGNTIRTVAKFADIDGNFIDPDSVQVLIRYPDNTVVPHTPIKDSVGNYHYDLNIPNPGIYYYRYQTTGGILAANDGAFMAVSSPVIYF